MKKMPGPMKPVLILQIVVCSTAGLSLLPASDLTVQNFSLVCDFEGAAWTSILLFNYNGKSGGGCGSPPNPTCTSSIGTITTSNDQTATLTLSQSNILTVGDAEWTCTHASQPTGRYNASVIAVCSNGVVKQEDKKLNIRCSCGFPSVKATLEYQDEDENSLSSSVAVLENATSSTSCVDTRAMDFSYQAPYFPSSASKVCVTFTTLSQISAQVKNCTKIVICPIPVYAILPVTLIVLLGTVIVIVVASCTDKDGKLKEGSKKKSYCPSENKFCRVVCPLCTNPLCTDSGEKCCTGLSVTVKNVLSVVVITAVAIIIGVIIAFGLGLYSGKCILALVLSIVCGVALLVIFIFSVYPHCPCVSEKEENAGESGNQGSPKKDTQLRMK